MRSFTSARPAWSASSTARAAARSVLSSVRAFHGISSTVSSQVRIQPASGEASLARSSRPTSRMRRLAHLLGQVGGLDPGPVVGRAVRLVLAELLADRGELLAQQELALGLLQPLADVGVDLLGDLLLGEVVAHPADQQLQPGGDVRRGEQFDLLVQGQPGRVAGRVGQLGQVGHPLDRVDDLPGAALLEHRGHQGLVLAGELPGRPAGAGSSIGVASTHSAAPGPGTPEPMRARAVPRITAAGSPLGSRPTFSIVAIVPNGAVLAVDPGHGEHAVLVVAGRPGRVDRGLRRGVQQ